jgi:hypothetical protein
MHTPDLKYQVYELVDSKSNMPFYVGFAKNPGRPLRHLKEHNRWRTGRKIKNANYYKLRRIGELVNLGYDFQYRFIFESNNEDDAYKMETKMILYYGRIDIGTGILTNMTNSGRGLINPSEEVREKIRIGNQRPLIDKLGPERAAAIIRANKDFALTTEGHRIRSESGKKGAQHIINNGWSEEVIKRRQETRKRNGTQTTDMSAANTPESIAKRIRTRKEKGLYAPENARYMHNKEAVQKSRKTKLRKLIVRIQNQYKQNISVHIIQRAKEDKFIDPYSIISMDRILELFSTEDIHQLSCGESQ